MASLLFMAALALNLARSAADFLPVQWGPQSTAGPAEAADHILIESYESDPRHLTTQELGSLIESDLASLGSLSIGTVGSGILLNAVPMPSSPAWEIVNPEESWGTAETIDFIQIAIAKVRELYPESPPLGIGDISLPPGGTLNRHATHQAGRDVDLGFFYMKGKGWWLAPGNSRNLDLPRNWALVRSLLALTDVERILLDWRIQKLIYQYAVSIGEDRDWLDRVFQFSKGVKEAVIQHVKGHLTHYHVRFYSLRAQELGRRAYPHLLRLKKINPPVFTVSHRVRSGETLSSLARRYGTSVRSIQKANSLSGSLVVAGRTYRIPCKGVAAPPGDRLSLPARLIPPLTPQQLAAVDWPGAPPVLGLNQEKLSSFR